jgi:hypothetical protein
VTRRAPPSEAMGGRGEREDGVADVGVVPKARSAAGAGRGLRCRAPSTAKIMTPTHRADPRREGASPDLRYAGAARGATRPRTPLAMSRAPGHGLAMTRRANPPQRTGLKREGVRRP